MRARALLLGALVLAGVGMVTAATPAKAECLEVTFEIHKEGEPHWYPLGGPESCVKDTPWNQGQPVRLQNDTHGLPDGTPKGFWLEVWLVGP